eukprot:TRINITY_DN7969_c0_g1_i1.p1 TRINITY_DN7969_c0_g1~~TRINITY_DN7969_c0_g1_i1.p1  ORF type:complete len:134 (+),score=15.75 TRINITY_DN7969_c0_g1_i1:67-468(+)
MERFSPTSVYDTSQFHANSGEFYDELLEHKLYELQEKTQQSDIDVFERLLYDTVEGWLLPEDIVNRLEFLAVRLLSAQRMDEFRSLISLWRLGVAVEAGQGHWEQMQHIFSKDEIPLHKLPPPWHFEALRDEA